jgi:hypothetical protein
VGESVPGAHDGKWKGNKNDATSPRAKNAPKETKRAPVVPKVIDIRVILMLLKNVQANPGKKM